MRASSPGSRSLSPESRRGGSAIRPAARPQSPKSTLRRNGCGSSVGSSANLHAAVSSSSSLSCQSGSVATSAAAANCSPAALAQRDRSSMKVENEDLRLENARLQSQLCKARTMINLQRKQLDEAMAVRDRERLRAESLQSVARELQRRLDEESSKANVLQRTITNAISEHASHVAMAAAQGSSEAPPRSHSSRSPNGSQSRRSNGSSHVSGFAPKASPGSPRQPSEDHQGSLDEERWKEDDLEEEEDDCDQQKGQGQERRLHYRLHRRQVQASSGKHLHLGTLEEEEEDGEEEALEQEHPDDEAHVGQQQESQTMRSWEYVVQGQYDSSFSEQLDFAPKLVSCFPEDAVSSAKSRGVAFVCSRGRRADATVPNQDDFVLARHSLANDGHIALYGVFDGHGPAGHHCAAYARGLLPESLFGQGSLLAGPEEALKLAFAQVQAGMLKQPFDAETSGTTAVVGLVLHMPAPPDDPSQQGESWLYVANVGDSRAVLVSRKGVHRLTRDHRPDDDDEAQRVQSEGGEVRRLRPGSGTSRIYAPGCQWPALALTRSLGAAIAGACGVSSEPEIASRRLTPGGDELLILGTDGLFEFCNTKEVASRLSSQGVADEVLEDVCAAARRRWARSSYNETVDDITVVAVSLDQSLGGRSSIEVAAVPAGGEADS